MQNLWQQNYDPAGEHLAVRARSPHSHRFFFLALTTALKGYFSGTVTVLLALGVALFYNHAQSALASAVYGFFGLCPSPTWIIVAAVFLYKLSVKTGQFDASAAPSCRSRTTSAPQLIPRWAFASVAFWKARLAGAPVAITAALLVAGLSAAVRRRFVPDCQHRPCGVWRHGHSGHRGGQVSGIDLPHRPDGRANCPS